LRHRVIIRPAAVADLRALYDYIEQNSPSAAARYVERIEDFCMKLSDFPERGTRRDDLRPGIRIIGFNRRVAVAFYVGKREVEIARILYGGRDLARALEEDEPEL
jgi:toxin ParE1/3/4